MGKIVRQRPITARTVLFVAFGALIVWGTWSFQHSVVSTKSSKPTANGHSPKRQKRTADAHHSETTVKHRVERENEEQEEDVKLVFDLDAIKKSCQLTKGDWCQAYKTQTPIKWRPPPRGTNECLWNCNNVGVCDAMKGFCFCPAGWQGDACDVPMPRPCSQKWRASGFEAYDKPIDWSIGGLFSRCAGECDKDIGLCYCPSNTTYGRIPAAITAPPGTPPTRMGRPMGMHCQPTQKPDGSPAEFGYFSTMTLKDLDDWCNNPEPKKTCPCYHDHLGGMLCDKVKEAFCPNQCNGHGECYLGFCKCQEGWFGHDCAYRMQGVEWTPGLEKERPWLKDVVHTPAAKDPEPGARRNRPLIYVYELPPRYHSHLMQYRNDGGLCHHRCFHVDDHKNHSITSHGSYNLETGLHEFLLQSEHRTLDPEEADFFYIPIYATCQIMPIHGWGDHPHFHGGPGTNRVQAVTNMMIEAHSWIRSHYPYWNRKGGRDHFLLSAHDEGSCYVPSVLRNATIFAHWGYMGLNNFSFTNYGADSFDREYIHHVYQPEGHLSKLGLHPCYDPKKDLVLPLMWPPEKYQSALVFAASTRERVIFAFHKGRVMHEFPKYSRGSRQKLNNLTVQHNWWENHRIYVGEKNPPGVQGSYSDLLASSVFCLVLMGDGWSARFDDAVLHGCIPVIIMDNVHVGFESIIDITKFSVRLSFADMEKLPEKLQAIDKIEIEKMQKNLSKVWRRYFYSGLKMFTPIVQGYLDERRESTKNAPILSQPPPLTDYNPAEEDAFATIIEWLYSRIDDA